MINNDTHEEFKERMIKSGEKQLEKTIKRKGKKKSFTDPKVFQDPYQISPHGNIYSTSYKIVEKYENGEFVEYELD